MLTNHQNLIQDLTLNRAICEEEFPESVIKNRKGFNGDTLNYIEAWAIIERLNNAFNANWSFEVIKHEIIRDELIVLGRLSAKGVTKEQFGSWKLSNGNDKDKPTNYGDAFKAASSDALKKTATLLGIGLYLYKGESKAKSDPKVYSDNQLRSSLQQDEKKDGGNGEDRNGWNNNSENNKGSCEEEFSKMTQKQLNFLVDIAQQKNIDLKSKASETFHKCVDSLSKDEASTLISEVLAC
ncbi:MAG: Rad52/Rad22 family DNA repair protein [Pseudomonadota bacterium]